MPVALPISSFGSVPTEVVESGTKMKPRASPSEQSAAGGMPLRRPENFLQFAPHVVAGALRRHGIGPHSGAAPADAVDGHVRQPDRRALPSRIQPMLRIGVHGEPPLRTRTLQDRGKPLARGGGGPVASWPARE